MSEHLILSLGMLFLLLLSVVNVVVVIVHVRYIFRVTHRLAYIEGQSDLILESISMQNNMLIRIVESK